MDGRYRQIDAAARFDVAKVRERGEQGERRPRFRRCYTSREQAQREADAVKFVRAAESSIAAGLRDAESGVLRAFAVFARAALDLDDGAFEAPGAGIPILGRAWRSKLAGSIPR